MLRTLLCKQMFVGALCKQKQAAAQTSLKTFSSTFSSETLEDLDDNGIIFEADKVHRLHRPVLEREVVDIFRPQNGEVYIDMTFGAGGHTRALLREAPEAKMFVLDRDSTAFTIAKSLALNQSTVTAVHGRFCEVHRLLSEHGVTKDSVDGILFDVGVSSMQFDQPHRGFSISKDGPLDMRMDASRADQPTASDVVNYMDEEGLHRILKIYGEEKKARLIARAIVEARSAFGHITTTKQLADVVSSVFYGSHRQDMLMRRSHVATKTFQALRIFVNDELNELYNGLVTAHHLLKPGRLCVGISFHSLEDRIFKRHFHGIDMDESFNMSVTDKHRNSAKIHSAQEMEPLFQKKWRPLKKQALLATDEEVDRNPRARSAKLRAAEKIP